VNTLGVNPPDEVIRPGAGFQAPGSGGSRGKWGERMAHDASHRGEKCGVIALGILSAWPSFGARFRRVRALNHNGPLAAGALLLHITEGPAKQWRCNGFTITVCGAAQILSERIGLPGPDRASPNALPPPGRLGKQANENENKRWKGNEAGIDFELRFEVQFLADA